MIYISRYNFIVKDNLEILEPVFQIINKIAYILFKDYQGVVIITSTLYLFAIFYATKEFSINIQYTVVLFFLYDFYFIGITQIRQYTGIAFFLIGLCFFKKRKYWIAILFTIIASLTHTVCILFLAVFLLSKINISKTAYVISILSSVFLLFIAKGVTNWLFLHIADGRFSYYISNGYYDIDLKLIIPLLETWGLSFFYVMIWDKVRKDDINNIFINCSLVASIFAVMGNVSSETYRVADMFLLPQIFFIPSIVKYLKRNSCVYVIWGLYLMGVGFVFIYRLIRVYVIEFPYYISNFFV